MMVIFYAGMHSNLKLKWFKTNFSSGITTVNIFEHPVCTRYLPKSFTCYEHLIQQPDELGDLSSAHFLNGETKAQRD